MKKTLTLLSALLIGVTSFGADAVVTTTFSPPNVLAITGPATIHRVQFLSGNGASTLTLYDSAVIATTNSSGIPVIITPATTNFVSYPTNFAQVTTNTYGGTTTTNTIVGIYTGTSVAAQATNALPVLLSALAAANSVNDTTGLNITVTRGVIANLSATNNGTVAITYTPEGP